MSGTTHTVHYRTIPHSKSNGRHHGIQHDHNGRPHTFHLRRDARLDELIAAYAVKGVSPKLLREVAALATSKGMRKLTQGFTC